MFSDDLNLNLISLPATDMITIPTAKHYTNYNILTDWGPNCQIGPICCCSVFRGQIVVTCYTGFISEPSSEI